MSPRPTSLPRWATSASVVEPSLGKKAQGWLSAERPAAGMLNWLQRNLGEWVLWLMSGSRALPWYIAVAIVGQEGTHRAIAVLDSTTTLGGMMIITASGVTTVRSCALVNPSWIPTTLAGGAPASDFVLGALAANAVRFVIVGANGRIQTYEAGAWTQRTAAAGFTGQFHDVLWTGAQFVAIGADFEVQTSPDGITWTRRASAAPTGGPNTVSYLRTIAQAGGRLVRGGANTANKAELWYSDDGGTTWVWAYTATAGSTTVGKVIGTMSIEGTPIFAASHTATVVGSSGGIQWTELAPGLLGSLSCTYEDMLLADGGRYVSTDGLTWNVMPFTDTSLVKAAVSRQGWALLSRTSGGTPELARTPVQRWF